MQIILKTFATLRNYLSSGQTTYTHDDPITVNELLRVYGIPENEVTIILVNGHSASLEKELKDGDTVSIFPAVGGG